MPKGKCLENCWEWDSKEVQLIYLWNWGRKTKTKYPVIKKSKHWKNMNNLNFDLAKHLNIWNIHENTDRACYKEGSMQRCFTMKQASISNPCFSNETLLDSGSRLWARWAINRWQLYLLPPALGRSTGVWWMDTRIAAVTVLRTGEDIGRPVASLSCHAACWCAVLAYVSCLLKLPCLVVSAHPSRCLRCSSARWSQLHVEHFPCMVSKWNYSTSTFLMAFCSSGLGVVCKFFLAFSCFFLLSCFTYFIRRIMKLIKI